MGLGLHRPRGKRYSAALAFAGKRLRVRQSIRSCPRSGAGMVPVPAIQRFPLPAKDHEHGTRNGDWYLENTIGANNRLDIALSM